MSPVFLFVVSSSPLEKAGAVTSGRLEQDLNQRNPRNLYNGRRFNQLGYPTHAVGGGGKRLRKASPTHVYYTSYTI
jgi:hypothetical protein